MKEIDLIIFDLDGTLVDSARDIAEAINHTLNIMGLEQKSVEEITRCIGGGFVDTLVQAFGKGNYEDRALPILREYYSEHAVVYSRLYPGVSDVLAHFDLKKKAVLTNKEYGISAKILNFLGIYDYFDVVIGCSDEKLRKPDPYYVLEILGDLHVNRERAIIVGDMDLDIAAGKRAGIATCGVTYGIGRNDNLLNEKPDIIIDSMIDLINYIK
jgi:HAD superfamily hydrolase (TIGR01509 family)